MFDSKFFDEMSKRLADAIPENVKVLRGDIEKQFRLVLQTMFAKLDLVTREEFDVQALVLSKTRGKLEKLEQRVIELEKMNTKKISKLKTDH